jgi:succinate dehydrogenase / fumarate reductase iron-sulfur subunit
MSDIRIFEIYRYDPDVDAAPRMERYELELTGERMLLDALISLKKQDESISLIVVHAVKVFVDLMP